MATKMPNQKTIIIDGAVYKGNSGSPVFETKEFISLIGWGQIQLERETPLIGLVTEFIPYLSPTYLRGKPIEIIDMQNAGYSVVEPVDFVISLIKKLERSLKSQQRKTNTIQKRFCSQLERNGKDWMCQEVLNLKTRVWHIARYAMLLSSKIKSSGLLADLTAQQKMRLFSQSMQKKFILSTEENKYIQSQLI